MATLSALWGRRLRAWVARSARQRLSLCQLEDRLAPAGFGLTLALGDLDADGFPDLVTGTGDGGGPHVRAFGGRDGRLMHDFFAHDPALRGGVPVAVGDVNGDGYTDLVLGAGDGGGPHVRAVSGRDGADLFSFFAGDPTGRSGVSVAVGDVTGDGVPDIVTGSGPGSRAAVTVYAVAGRSVREVGRFHAYDPGFLGGVSVAVGDLDGDGVGEVVTGPQVGGGPHVRAFAGRTFAPLANFFADAETLRNGATVAVGDRTGDGRAELLVGIGGGRTRAFDLAGQVLDEVAGFDPAGGLPAVASGPAAGGADLLAVATHSQTSGGVRVFRGAAETTRFDPYYVGADRPLTEFTAGAGVTVLPTAGGPTLVRVTVEERTPGGGGEFGVYPVDDALGRVGGLLPGAAGYAVAAIAAGARVSDGAGVFDLTLPAGVYGLYRVAGGTVARWRVANPDNRLDGGPVATFTFRAGNPDGQYRHLRRGPAGEFALETAPGGGDLDFDDLIAAFAFPTGTPVPPTVPPVLPPVTPPIVPPVTPPIVPPVVVPVVPPIVPPVIIKDISLREDDRFRTAVERTFTVPADPSVLRFDLAATFDAADPDSVKDAFEAAVLGADGKPLVHPATGTTDAFLNLTEGQPAALGAGATFDGRTATVTLAGIPAGTPVRVVLRLVNNDADTNTAAEVTGLRAEAGGGAAPSAVPPGTERRAAVALDLTSLTDVTASFAVDYARTTFHDETQELVAAFALRNVGRDPVAALALAVGNISDPAVRVRRADGATPDGRPYYTTAGGAGELTFFNPGRTPFTYDLTVLGAPNRDPVFNFVPDPEALLGQVYRTDAHATDPDGDAVTYALLSGPVGMTIDSQTGVITWAPTAADLGTAAVTVGASDGRGGATRRTFTVVVDENVPNRPPVVTSVPPTDGAVATAFTYAVVAQDEDNDPLAFALTAAPAGMAIDAATGLLTWTPTATQLGDSPVSVQVSDGRGGVGTQAFTVTVVAATGNSPPAIITTPQTTVVGEFRYDADALDPDADPVAFSLAAAPAGASIDPDTGLLSFTPPAAGRYDFAVRAADGRGGVDTQAFTLTVSAPGVVGSISGSVFEDRDGDGVRDVAPPLLDLGPTPYLQQSDSPFDLSGLGTTFFLEDFEDGLLNVPGVTANTGTVISGGIADGVDADDGVIDGVGRDGHDFFTGGSVRFTFDAAILGKLPTHAGLVWTDGSHGGTLITFEAFDADGRSLGTRTGNHGDPFVSSETAEDRFYGAVNAGGISAISFQNATGGLEIDHLQYGSQPLLPPPPDDEPPLGGWTVYLDRDEDGTRDADEPAAVTGAGGTYTFAGLPAGRYVVREEVQAGWVQTAPTAPGTHVIDLLAGAAATGRDFGNRIDPNPPANRPPVFTSTPPGAATAGRRYRYDAVVADPDPFDRPTFDLVVKPRGMAVDPARGVVIWTPGADQLGDHDVILRASDGRGGVALQAFRVAVGLPNTAPVITSTPGGPAVVGSPFEYRVRAQDAENDPLTYAILAGPTGMNIDPATGVLSWTPLANQVGGHAVTATVTDPRGASDRQAFTLSVAAFTAVPAGNRPPAFLSAPVVDGNVTSPYRYRLVAADDDGDPLTFALIAAPAGMVLDAEGLLTWTPTVGQAGPNAVRVTVRDGRGGSAAQSFAVTVRQAAGTFAPVIISAPVTAYAPAAVGPPRPYRYDVDAIDPDGDPVTYSLVTRPDAGMTIDPATGLIEWTPPEAFLTAGRVTFTDGTFAPADWTHLTLFGNGSASSSVDQLTSGGNPDSFRRTGMSSNGGSVPPDRANDVLHLSFHNKSVYDPQQQGAILNLDYSEDSRHFSGVQSGGGLVLRQNGRLFRVGFSVGETGGWVTSRFSGLTDSAFSESVVQPDGRVREGGTRKPDFSAGGSPIEFGYFRRANTAPGSSNPYSTTTGIDNWAVTVTPRNAASVLVLAQDGTGGQDRQAFTVQVARPVTVQGVVYDDRDGDGTWDRASDLVAMALGFRVYDAATRVLIEQDEAGAGHSVALGPDGAYYSSGASGAPSVFRHDPATGATSVFVSGAGLSLIWGITFGPDGHLYVGNDGTDNVTRFDGRTGQLLGEFARLPGGSFPSELTFGPDGNLYVLEHHSGQVLRFGPTGTALGVFATGTQAATGMTFGPDGNLYLSAWFSRSVTRFNGQTGASLGTFVAAGAGGLQRPDSMAFGPDGHLYVCDIDAHVIRQYDGATGVHVGVVIDFGAGREPQGILFAPRSVDPQEPGVAGRTVFLDLNRNGRRDLIEPSAATDANGQYRFDGLAPGDYRVAVELTPGFVPTAPPLQSYNLTVVEGQDAYQLDFGTAARPGGQGNRPPAFFTAPPAAATAGQPLIYPARATDPDGDPLTFAVVGGPAGLAVDPLSGVVVWVPEATQAGPHAVTVTVSDGRGGSADQAFTVTVGVPNTPPVITSVPGGPATAGRAFAERLRAQDADGDALTFALDAGPAGLTLDAATGLLTWTPTAGQAGPNAVTVTVTDARGATASETFTLGVVTGGVVNANPVITSRPRTVTGLGQEYLYGLRASDADGDRLTLSLDAGPRGMALDPLTGAVSWVPDGTQLGAHLVRLRAADGRGGEAVQEFTVTVGSTPVNSAPRIVSDPPLAATAGRPLGYDPVAEDADQDVLVWGLDAAPAGMSIDPQLGLIRWTPGADQNGPQPVTVRVTDALGGSGTQSFVIRVRGANSSPWFVSAPPTRGGTNRAYTYTPRTLDPDGDAPTFSLPQAPEGMTVNPITGRLDWSPTAAQVGPNAVTVRVEDGNGGSATQSFSVLVTDRVNRPPTITSTPPTNTSANGGAGAQEFAYRYAVTANDADGDRLTFSLEVAPAGMTIDAVTGRVVWLPRADQVGAHPVTVRASDPDGASAAQRFTIAVRAGNRFPVLDGPPLQTAAAGQPYRFLIPARDPDGDPLTFTLVSSPAGLTVDAGGRLFWATALADVGLHDVELTIADDRGAEIELGYQIAVRADASAPRVRVQVSENPTNIGGPVVVRVTAADDTGVTALTLTAGGVAVPLDATGRATLRPGQAGLLALVATASDAAGNAATASAELIVRDPSDVTGPVVTVTSPGDGQLLTTFADVVGSVTDDNLLFYTVSVADAAGGRFTEVARGTSPVTNGVLGRFDPTLLETGSYTLRVQAVDAGGNVATVDRVVGVGGNLKLGNFRLAFTDLVVPVSGIPIVVARTYDTLTAGRDEGVGFGWRLEVRDTDLRVNVAPTGDEADGVFNPFRDRTRVTLVLPDGTRQGFTFTPRLRFSLFDLQLFRPEFVPDPGVTSTLTVDQFDLQRSGNEYLGMTAGGLAYNPADGAFGGKYTLTTKEGVVYVIDGQSGDLRTVTDRNGNRLTYTANGVSSSAGPAVTFGRDARGRVTSMTDPLGATVRYAYDAAGDLVGVTDRAGNVTRFAYRADRPHFLDSVTDPLGRTGARADYGPDGRLATLFDAAGNPVRLAFDTAADTQTVTDALGHTTVYQYDRRGNVVRQVDALGGVTARTYDANDNPLSVTDALGRTTTRAFDRAGNELSDADPLGAVTRSTYGRLATRLSVTDPLGRTSTTTYDRKANERTVTDPAGFVVTAEVDEDGNVVAATDPAGSRVVSEINRHGLPTREVDGLGHEARYTYDANGRETSRTERVTTPAGLQTFVTAKTYDATGLLLTETAADGAVTRHEYDALGRRTATTDPIGRRTEYGFDAVGNEVEVRHPDGGVERSGYDAARRRTSATDRAGRTTRYAYDALDRLVVTTLPDDALPGAGGTRESTEYDAAGQVTATVDPLGRRTESVYDAAGLLTVRRDALGRETRYAYDAAGQLTAVTDPLGHTTRYAYDPRGLPARTEFADETADSTAYDALRLPSAVTDPAGLVTRHEYDAAGRLVAVTDAAGGRTAYAYDEAGRLTRQTDANGHATAYEYDALGRRTATVRPLGQRSEDAYDAAGQLTSSTDFNGAVTRYTYDAAGRRSAEQFPGGGVTTYTHTPTGQVASVTDARGSVAFGYDARDRLTSRTEPDGRQVRYAYDAAGNRTAVTSPSGTTAYTTDALGRIETVTGFDGGVTRYAYDAAGNRTRAELPNGTVEVRAYDALDRLVSVEHTGPGGVLAAFGYALDATGRRTGATEADGRRVGYAYDALHRLTRETIIDAVAGGRTVSYSYDAVGNRLSRTDSVGGVTTYTYDDNDRLLSEATAGVTTSYGYDANGNTLTRDAGPADRAAYTWDAENQLLSEEVTTAAGTRRVTFAYDADGVRVATAEGAGETRYLIDETGPFAQVLEEYAPDGTTRAAYVYGAERIGQSRGGLTSVYLTGGDGTVRGLTAADGTVSDRSTFDAFGRELGRTGATVNPFGYRGESLDAATGWYYLRARSLDPATGRFPTADPAAGRTESPVSLHRYLYADADPVNASDPSGRYTLAELAASTSFVGTITIPLVNGARIVQNSIVRVNTAMLYNNLRLAALELGRLPQSVTQAAQQLAKHLNGFNVNTQQQIIRGLLRLENDPEFTPIVNRIVAEARTLINRR